MKSGGEGRFALALKLRKFLGSEKEGGCGMGGGESQGGKERKATTCSWRKDLIWCSIICSAVSSGGRVNHCRDNIAPPPHSTYPKLDNALLQRNYLALSLTDAFVSLRGDFGPAICIKFELVNSLDKTELAKLF